MGRIRTLKPEFPQSESLGKVSRDARLTFAMVLTVADDEGRARASPRLLASLLFPFDDDAPGLIEGWLVELEKVGCVRRYSVDGTSYLDIPQWTKHQKIDRPSASRLPGFVTPSIASTSDDARGAFDDNSTNPREPTRGIDEHARSVDADLGPRTLDQDQSSLRSDCASQGDEILVGDTGSKLTEADMPTNRDGAAAKNANLPQERFWTEWRKFLDDFRHKGGERSREWRAWLARLAPQPASGVASPLAPIAMPISKPKATRLPADWRPNENGWAVAVRELGEESARRELVKFLNYWAAKPKNATKLDWGKTWENWVMKAADDRRPRAGPTSGVSRSNGGDYLAKLSRECDQEMEFGHVLNEPSLADPFTGITIDAVAETAS
jgi:hypothetical protein